MASAVTLHGRDGGRNIVSRGEVTHASRTTTVFARAFLRQQGGYEGEC